MAPTAAVATPRAHPWNPEGDVNGHSAEELSQLTSALDINGLYKRLVESKFKEQDKNYEHDALRPSYPDLKWDALEVVEVPKDRGLFGAKDFKNLLSAASAIEHLTPTFGTILYGIDLDKLTDAQKDDLARFTAYRGVVFFRDQKDLDIKKQLALGKYWGKLHRHATTALPKGSDTDPELLDVHVIWADENRLPSASFTPTHLWHSDVSYELQPPSYTSLKVVQGPPVGGDTLWTSGYALYDALSPGLQKYLEEHTALHSAHEQAAGARRVGKAVRREPVVSEHPLVRVNPVTGYKSVYVNPGFTRTIVGVPQAESKAILDYLYELIATDVEHTVRWKWNPNDVAVWDNRVTSHSASWGFFPHRRHGVRVTTTGEVPAFDPKGISQLEELEKTLGFKFIDKDGSHKGNYND